MAGVDLYAVESGDVRKLGRPGEGLHRVRDLLRGHGAAEFTQHMGREFLQQFRVGIIRPFSYLLGQHLRNDLYPRGGGGHGLYTEAVGGALDPETDA